MQASPAISGSMMAAGEVAANDSSQHESGPEKLAKQ